MTSVSTAIAIDQPQPLPSRWSLAQRALFRFCFCYFLLYILPDSGHVNLLDVIPGINWLSKAYIGMWHAIVPWVAIHVFHLSGPSTVYPAVNGSGDSTLDYVQHACFVAIALAVTLIWSVLDRKRPDYRRLHQWFRVLVRYNLAFTMFGYGFAKVIPLQFAAPSLGRLLEPLGEFSPMGLLWTFIGFSKAYTIFSGAVEVTGGAFLLFRRTATLGAMVSSTALVNIVMMNFCYDVPVKLYSVNLLLMAIFIMAPDLRRVANCLLFNRATEPAQLGPPPLPKRWMRIGAAVFQILFLGFYLYPELKGGIQQYRERVLNPPKAPLYGIWDVERFTRKGEEVAPLVTDKTRWKRLAIQRPQGLSIRMMDDTPVPMTTKYDEAKATVTMGKDVFRYSRPDPEHVLLEGQSNGGPLTVQLRKVDLSKFLLTNRGFHWINERPFNR